MDDVITWALFAVLSLFIMFITFVILMYHIEKEKGVNKTDKITKVMVHFKSGKILPYKTDILKEVFVKEIEELGVL